MREPVDMAAKTAATPHPTLSGGPRVLFVSHSSSMGGAEFMLMATAAWYEGRSAVCLFEDGPFLERLLQSGTPTVIAGKTAFTEIRRDSSLLRAVPAMGKMASTVRAIARHARRYDVIYANSQKAFVLAAPAAFLARRPLIWHLHDILVRKHFGASQIRLGVTLANLFATRVIVCSNAAAEAFTAAGGRGSLLQVIPNGVEIAPIAETAQQLRERHNIPPGFTFGVFSRLARWKGQAVAVRALALLPGMRAVFAGGPLFGEHAYADELYRLVDELGVRDRVVFTGHREDVPDLMRAVDVVVHPSIDPEPFGRTLVEGMLCRIPVVAAQGGASAEVLGSDGKCGTIVPAGDPVALAEALKRLQENPVLAAGMVSRANERALKLFNVPLVRAMVEALVAETVSRRSGPMAGLFQQRGTSANAT